MASLPVTASSSGLMPSTRWPAGTRAGRGGPG